jgi:transcription initiation factor TFIIB
LVIGNVISDESEWRTFSDRRGDDPNRVGGPEIGLLADAGLATLMGDNPNGMGNSLAKLQNANALSKNHRKLVDAFRRSSAMAALLHLPNSLKNRSDELYKRVLESGLVRHRGVDALMAACIFMVCKAEGVPRTIKEMTAVCEITPKELARCFKEMKRAGMHKTLVGSRFDTKNSGTTAASAERGEDSEHGGDAELQSYVARWGNHLRLPLKLIELAKELATRTQSSLTTSKDPASFGGAALFLAAQCSGALQDRRTYEQIETECRIATNTLRAVVQQMLQPTLVTVVLPQAYHHCIPQLTA